MPFDGRAPLEMCCATQSRAVGHSLRNDVDSDSGSYVTEQVSGELASVWT